jgi:hypothetical protein
MYVNDLRNKGYSSDQLLTKFDRMDLKPEVDQLVEQYDYSLKGYNAADDMNLTLDMFGSNLNVGLKMIQEGIVTALPHQNERIDQWIKLRKLLSIEQV